MGYLIQTLIYLMAILGIVLTSISIYEMFDYNKYINSSYRIYSNNNNKNIEIIVKLYDVDEVEEEKIVELLKNDDVIKDISHTVIIQKENNN